MERHLQAPISKEELKTLKSRRLCIYYELFIQRGMLRIKMYETLQNQENLPIDIQNRDYLLYGVVSGKKEDVLSVLQVTTASRMDKYPHSFWILGWVR